MKKVKILVVLGDLKLCNGVSSYAMNYYKYLDTESIHMDFVLTRGGADEQYERLIKARGGKIFIVKSTKIIDNLKNLEKIKKIMQEGHYDIVHSHIINVGYFYLKYAKKYGVKSRIIHSHTILQKEKSVLKAFLNKTFIKLVNIVSNVRFACSDEAGKSLFGKRKYIIINNAIEIERYLFNLQIRNQQREKYNINNKMVIGHIGRFSEEKNHIFIIDLFKQIKNENENVVLMLIGEGALQASIKERVKEYGLENDVMFIGQVGNVEDYLQMMDIFIFPSFYEGAPIAVIEAQVNGLVTLLSDRVPKASKIIDKTKFLKLNDIEEWKKEILNVKIHDRKSQIENIINTKIDIQSEAIKLEKLYRDLLK